MNQFTNWFYTKKERKKEMLFERTKRETLHFFFSNKIINWSLSFLSPFIFLFFFNFFFCPAKKEEKEEKKKRVPAQKTNVKRNKGNFKGRWWWSSHFSSFDLAPLSFVCVAFKKHESAKPDERGFKRERERGRERDSRLSSSFPREVAREEERKRIHSCASDHPNSFAT